MFFLICTLLFVSVASLHCPAGDTSCYTRANQTLLTQFQNWNVSRVNFPLTPVDSNAVEHCNRIPVLDVSNGVMCVVFVSLGKGCKDHGMGFNYLYCYTLGLHSTDTLFRHKLVSEEPTVWHPRSCGLTMSDSTIFVHCHKQLVVGDRLKEESADKADDTLNDLIIYRFDYWGNQLDSVEVSSGVVNVANATILFASPGTGVFNDGTLYFHVYGTLKSSERFCGSIANMYFKYKDISTKCASVFDWFNDAGTCFSVGVYSGIVKCDFEKPCKFQRLTGDLYYGEGRLIKTPNEDMYYVQERAGSLRTIISTYNCSYFTSHCRRMQGFYFNTALTSISALDSCSKYNSSKIDTASEDCSIVNTDLARGTIKQTTSQQVGDIKRFGNYLPAGCSVFGAANFPVIFGDMNWYLGITTPFANERVGAALYMGDQFNSAFKLTRNGDFQGNAYANGQCFHLEGQDFDTCYLIRETTDYMNQWVIEVYKFEVPMFNVFLNDFNNMLVTKPYDGIVTSIFDPSGKFQLNSFTILVICFICFALFFLILFMCCIAKSVKAKELEQAIKLKGV